MMTHARAPPGAEVLAISSHLEPSRAISSSESPPWLAISPRSQVLTISVALGTAIPLGIFARLLASCQALGTCYKVWRTGCHMLSRHLEAIEHLWFEIRDKHWGSGSSFKKGHRARISGECEVDASVLLQATEESNMLSSEAAVKEEVERACTEPDAPLPCMHTLTTAPFRESLHRTRRAPAVHAYAHDGAPGLPQAKAADAESFQRKRDAGSTTGEYELVVHGCERGATDEL